MATLIKPIAALTAASLLLACPLASAQDADFDSLEDLFELQIINANPLDAIMGLGDVLSNDDFDTDGLSNLVEFALGTDPTDPSSLGNERGPNLDLTGNPLLTIIYRVDPLLEVTPQFATIPDVANWGPLINAPIITPLGISPEGVPLQQADYELQSSVDDPVNFDFDPPRSFYRLEINLSVDEDEDGIPDSWEQLILDADPSDGIATIQDVDPLDDFDGDQLNNGDEFLLGHLPTIVDFDSSGTIDFYYVDNVNGQDGFDGAASFSLGNGVGPKNSLAAAIGAAASGDTVITMEGTGAYPLADFAVGAGKSLTFKSAGIAISFQ